MKTVLRILAALAASAALALPAHAITQGPGQNACKEDVATYCGNVERGEGRITRCLMDHSGEVSDGCRLMLGSIEDRLAGRAPGPLGDDLGPVTGASGDNNSDASLSHGGSFMRGGGGNKADRQQQDDGNGDNAADSGPTPAGTRAMTATRRRTASRGRKRDSAKIKADAASV